jgi:hypothetical protein
MKNNHLKLQIIAIYPKKINIYIEIKIIHLFLIRKIKIKIIKRM